MLRLPTLFVILLSLWPWSQVFASDCASRAVATASLLQVSDTQSTEFASRNHTYVVSSSTGINRVNGEVHKRPDALFTEHVQTPAVKTLAGQHVPVASSQATKTPGTLAAGLGASDAKDPEQLLSCSLLRGQDPAGKDDRVTCIGRRFAPVDDSMPGMAAVQACNRTDPDELERCMYAVCCICCIACAAIAAGLTMGLVSLEEFNLKLLLEVQPQDLKTQREREELAADQADARAVKPIISGHFFSKDSSMPASLNPTNNHYVLVTLLVMNALANEALPVFLSHLVHPMAAVLISVSFVLFFGEIIPSAIFTGPGQLSIAAKFAGVVNFLKLLAFPIVWPISLTLDAVLGHEDEEDFNRGKMKALARMQRRRTSVTTLNGSNPDSLHDDEVKIIHGALDLHNRTVADIQKNIDSAQSLPDTGALDEDTMANILHMAKSRIFIHGPTPRDIRGVLLVKRLITFNPHDPRPMSKVPLRKPLVFTGEEDLLHAINRFQEGHSHLALISADPDAVDEAWKAGKPIPEHALPVGFLALEDVVEEVLQEKVYDELDRKKLCHSLLPHRLRNWLQRARKRLADQETQEICIDTPRDKPPKRQLARSASTPA